MVFILVALDKIHYSRGPVTLRNVESPKERDYAVTVTFEVDVERSVPSALPVVTLSRSSDSESAMGETKQEQNMRCTIHVLPPAVCVLGMRRASCNLLLIL
ncbi:hypothetical protein PENSPDRAFT_659567 [Peniophora sp. CONT]|nr:hypothetical protein PENSPDRAFT_659567 [Peniophora sp. CONT]